MNTHLDTSSGFRITEIASPPLHLQHLRALVDGKAQDEVELQLRRVPDDATVTVNGALASIMELDGIFRQIGEECHIDIEMGETSVLKTTNIDSVVSILASYRRRILSETLTQHSVIHATELSPLSSPILRLLLPPSEIRTVGLSIIGREEAIVELDSMISFLESARVGGYDVEFDA